MDFLIVFKIIEHLQFAKCVIEIKWNHLDLQYIFQVPGADTAAIAAISAAALTNGGRICGRVLASITAAESDDTIAGVGTVCGK